ncbi:NADPH-sulfite reductase flavoprotein subunit [gamma proteobacterium HdN1]|nr:NADPH-sulfite reductase flavoprotein subunit [gamma proteobacterium HdN1]
MTTKSPFLLSEQQTSLLETLISEMEQPSLLWTSGYLAGLAMAQRRVSLAVKPQEAAAATVAAAPVAKSTLTILYGSQTGNAKRLAQRFAAESEAAGLSVQLVDVADYAVRKLKSETHLFVVISTQGDGEPPDSAREFFEFLHGKKAPKLDTLQYAVLALGDSSYPDFCGVGRKIDERLAALGAKRIHNRGDCDLDIETVAEPWWVDTLNLARTALAPAGSVAAPQQNANVIPLHPSASAWNRDKPFSAQVLENQRITARGTDKHIFHLELSLEGSGLHYQPGDSLGVWHFNPPSLVDNVLATLGVSGDQTFTHKGETFTLRQWFSEKLELTRLTRAFLVEHSSRVNAGVDQADLQAALAEGARDALAAFLGTHQLIDLLKRFPANWTAETLITSLRPLTPRLYSISSSQTVAEDEVHLTVAKVAYDAHGEAHLGAASGFLAELPADGQLPIYIEENRHFRLPKNADRDVIMVGPGTGVAPFRAFLQERIESGAAGRNWLFFGAQHFDTQFLYQTEWQDALKKKHLNRIDLAFSRDQQEKIYVQHLIEKQGAELYAWLQNGAHFYVCGSTDMEKDVKAALLKAIAQHSGKGDEFANAWFAEAQKEGRYSRDVY